LQLQKFIVTNAQDDHNVPQFNFLSYNGELVKNITIFKQESLNEDLRKYGFVDFNEFKNKNKTQVDYFTYLNTESINLINKIYSKDFEFFNYFKEIKILSNCIPSPECPKQ
jgi:hypothetical protein